VLFGLLDQPAAFARVGAGVRHRRTSVELDGAIYQGRQVAQRQRPAAGAQLRLKSAELLGCYAALPLAIGALELCAGARFEYLTAAAFGVTDPDAAGVLLASVVGAARGRLRATAWLSATLDLGLAARPFHPTFVLIGMGNVLEISVVSPFARTGLALEF
jgi:hypothetical protein